jgi:hypothetical protein
MNYNIVGLGWNPIWLADSALYQLKSMKISIKPDIYISYTYHYAGQNVLEVVSFNLIIAQILEVFFVKCNNVRNNLLIIKCLYQISVIKSYV